MSQNNVHLENQLLLFSIDGEQGYIDLMVPSLLVLVDPLLRSLQNDIKIADRHKLIFKGILGAKTPERGQLFNTV